MEPETVVHKEMENIAPTGHERRTMTLARALVSLTFDDALDEHLDCAVPILDKFGVAGTFYVNVGSECFSRRYREWEAAAKAEHELGNHTIFHPGVSSKSWVTEGIALEAYTLDRMRIELIVANRVLEMVDGVSRRSFAFPCDNPWMGHPGLPRRALTMLGLERTRAMGWVNRFRLDFGSHLVDYTPVVKSLFPAARCGGIDVEHLPTVPRDPHRVRAVSGDGMTLSEMERAVETAVSRGAWLVFAFHGISGGHHMSVDKDALSGLVAMLSTDSRVETLTFLNAARRIWPDS